MIAVVRPYPAALAAESVAQRVCFGILHDPDGRYTVGPVVIPSKPWGGHFALLAHTGRADHRLERVWTTDEDDRPAKAARAFVEAIGAGAAMDAVRRFDERHGWAA